MDHRTHRTAQRELRLWPALLAVTLQWIIVYTVSLFGATTLGDFYGTVLAPLATALFLLIWWLLSRQIPLAERVLGAVLFVLPLLWLAWFHRPLGYMVVMRALPVTTTALVAALLLTSPLAWHARRRAAVAVLLLCGAFYTPVRVEGMRGNFTPDLAWRWEPTFEERADAWDAPNRVAELPATAGTGDWPRFRGPDGDSRVPGIRFATDWSTPPEELWRRPVGLGWSSFAAVGDYLFTQEQRGADEVIVCYEAATGEQVWATGSPVHFEDAMGPGPRATPTFADGTLYALGVTGMLRSLDAVSGEIRWQRDLQQDTGARTPQWGFASSPLVTEDLVLVFAGAPDGKGVAAYTRESGELAWTGGTGAHGYSSVSPVQIDGTPQFLIASNAGIDSLEPTTGALLWGHAWKVSGNPRVVQPVVLDQNAVYLGTAGGMGTRKLRVSSTDQKWIVAEEWTTRKFRPYFNDFVHHEGHFYGYDGNRLACIDAHTGEERWRGDRVGGQLLLLPEMGMLLVLTEQGKVLQVPATPDRFSVSAEFKAITGKTWNHPVIAHGRLYVRNSQEAACFVLPEQAWTR